MWTLEQLGYDEHFAARFELLADSSLVPARVAAEHGGAHRILGPEGEVPAVVLGRLRRDAQSRLDLPVVGDWVAVRRSADPAVIEHVLERKTQLVRRAPGDREEPQVLAANVDAILVVAAMDQRFSPRRIERFVTLVREGRAEPILVLSKADLAEDPASFLERLGPISEGIRTLVVSAHLDRGREALESLLITGKTLALIGTSGAGKSTLVNWLFGKEVRVTGAVRDHDQRGRHVTTDRALLPMPNGAILIDTPGLRELQLWEAAQGLEEAFPEIERLGPTCRFRDCAHGLEPGCAVRAAVDRGEISGERYDSYRKLRAEVESGRVLREAAERRRGRGSRRR